MGAEHRRGPGPFNQSPEAPEKSGQLPRAGPLPSGDHLTDGAQGRRVRGILELPIAQGLVGAPIARQGCVERPTKRRVSSAARSERHGAARPCTTELRFPHRAVLGAEVPADTLVEAFARPKPSADERTSQGQRDGARDPDPGEKRERRIADPVPAREHAPVRAQLLLAHGGTLPRPGVRANLRATAVSRLRAVARAQRSGARAPRGPSASRGRGCRGAVYRPVVSESRQTLRKTEPAAREASTIPGEAACTRSWARTESLGSRSLGSFRDRGERFGK